MLFPRVYWLLLMFGEMAAVVPVHEAEASVAMPVYWVRVVARLPLAESQRQIEVMLALAKEVRAAETPKTTRAREITWFFTA